MPLSLHRSRDRKYRRGFRGVGWFGLTSVLGCLMALPALATSGTQKAGDPQRPPAGPTISQAGSNALPELRARFATAWAAFRAGDEATRPELLACAKALADAGRADALTIAHFFVNLSPAQRRLGWEQEQAVYRLRERVQAAHEEHAGSLRTEGRPAPTDWPQERSAIQASLQALIAAVPEPGDPTPRAHAYALLARLDLARLDQGNAFATSLADRSTAVQLAARVQEQAQNACADFARAGLRTPQLEPLWILAECARLGGQPQRALEHYQALEDLAEHTQQPLYRSRALQGQVALAREAGDRSGVQTGLQRWAQFEAAETSWPLAHAQAMALLHEDRVAAALDHLWRCQPEAEADRPVWQAMLAAALRRRGHLPAARRALERLQEIAPHEGELLALTEAQQLKSEGRYARALAALLEHEPESHWSSQGQVQGWVLEGDLRLRLGQAAEALAPLGSALQAAEGWRARRLAGNARSGSVVGEWLGMHAVVLHAWAQAQSGQIEDAAQTVELYYARGQAQGNPARVRERIAHLRESGYGFLTFAFGPEFSIALHLGPDGWQEAARLDITRTQLQTALRRLHQATRDRDPQRIQALQHELAKALWPGPIAAGLPPAQPLGPDAPLHAMMHGPLEEFVLGGLPWHGQPLEARLRPVQRRHLWHAPREGAWDFPSVDWRFLGAPETNAHAPLPAARGELEVLAQSSPGSKIHLGAAFDRSALEQACRSDEALHLATHLIVAPDCALGFRKAQALVLTGDALLCANELAAWEPRLPLVVLGTCASGTGRYLDGEGSLGIVQAFLAGGTRNVIATRWPVSDEGARVFGERFHAALRAGRVPSDALRTVRLAMRADGFAARDWSAFVHWGED